MNEDLQVENGGFTRVANAILDELVKVDLRGSELRIILAIIRKTYGFQKKEDFISISQLVLMTELSKRNVIYLFQNLEAKKILLISREKEVNKIRFNKYSDTWLVQNSAPQVEKNRKQAKLASAKLRLEVLASAKLGKQLVQNSVKNMKSFAHTKERKKDTKESAAEAAPFPFQWERYLNELRKDPREHIRLIGFYFHKRGAVFDSYGEAQEAIRRHVRDAAKVMKFSKHKIYEAIGKCEEMKDIEWTLGTVLKVLTK